MAPVRGKPIKHDYGKMHEAILRRKSEIVELHKIVPKSMEIWKILSEELHVAVSGLYSYVTCNRNNIKDQILDTDFAVVNTLDLSDINNNTETSLKSISITSNDESEVRTVDVHFSRSEFAALLEVKNYKRSEKDRPKITRREYTVLKRGQWQLSVTKKLWEKAHIKCGFIFKTHKVCTTKSFSSHGVCKCGGSLTGIKRFTNSYFIS